MEEFTKGMNNALKQEIGNNTDIYLTYNALTGKVTVHLKPKCKLFLFDKLSLILGFGGKEVKIDKTVQPQIVGDTSAQLLRSIPVQGKYGEIVTKTFTK
ncbi:Hypothetical predicted protein [Paramuricea clavata]|uniref:Uncharacterized protein n=1 Tax=Paramuricea clavata TaxID=317549 RepID=A0A7D9EM08_PARCT|nr:Hypothetical predicted protein [Paramuricea clavata]